MVEPIKVDYDANRRHGIIKGGGAYDGMAFKVTHENKPIVVAGNRRALVSGTITCKVFTLAGWVDFMTLDYEEEIRVPDNATYPEGQDSEDCLDIYTDLADRATNRLVYQMRLWLEM